MQRGLLFIPLLLAIVTMAAGIALGADVRAGAVVTDDGVKGFYAAVGEFFKVPDSDFAVVRQHRVSDDELAVVFYIGQRTGIRPNAILELRSLNKSWHEIAIHFGMSPAMFYVPVTIDPGPPYGKALGHFKKATKSEWKKIVLDDEDIVNLVNLRVVSGYYHVPADQVVKARCEGKSFTVICRDLRNRPPKADNRAERAAKREKAKQRAQAAKE